MTSPVPSGAAPSPTNVRLDVWLDVSCLFKTRADAQRACRGGKIEVNGQPAKPHRLLRIGDEIRITRGPDRRQLVTVRGLAEKHVAKAEARTLYEDKTPPPTPAQLERRAFERAFRLAPPTAPDKRQRRAIRKLKGLPT
jgi:ribosome-associated heat shock protein Hsp15